MTKTSHIDVAAWVKSIVDGDRGALARAITCIESQLESDQDQADALLAALPRGSDTFRIGVTGIPGVGKSTFIEVLGIELLRAGHRVAVLAIDPSSQRSGGSVLGDKTRMHGLANDIRAFVRPSPARGALGGVESRTPDAIQLCEAAGFDVVIVETVGVGQSEIAVAALVDVVVWLALPGAGDELQGVKRGIMEVADIAVVHKADGDRLAEARIAKQQLEAALMMLSGAQVPVLLASSLDAATVTPVWRELQKKFADETLVAQKRMLQRQQQFDAALTGLAVATLKSDKSYAEATSNATQGNVFAEARRFVRDAFRARK